MRHKMASGEKLVMRITRQRRTPKAQWCTALRLPRWTSTWKGTRCSNVDLDEGQVRGYCFRAWSLGDIHWRGMWRKDRGNRRRAHGGGRGLVGRDFKLTSDGREFEVLAAMSPLETKLFFYSAWLLCMGSRWETRSKMF